MTASETLKYESARLGEGIYTSPDVARILKISKQRARYLINEYLDNKFRKQQNFRYKIESETSYAVNFLGLVEIYVFEQFRKLNVPSRKIIEIHNQLSGFYKSPYPFAKTDFLVSGRDVYFNEGNDWVSGNETFQIGLKEIIESLGEKIQYDDENIAAKYYPLGKAKSIVVDPEYRFGQPILRNTNLLVENIYDLYLAEEKNIDFVTGLYNISHQQMEDVIEYMAA